MCKRVCHIEVPVSYWSYWKRNLSLRPGGAQGAGGVSLLHLLGFGPSSQRIIELLWYAGRPQEEGNDDVRDDWFWRPIWFLMDKKARSKPMGGGGILSKLDEKFFRVVFFGDKEVIQNEPVEDWPVCDVLIASYSAGENITSSAVL